MKNYEQGFEEGYQAGCVDSIKSVKSTIMAAAALDGRQNFTMQDFEKAADHLISAIEQMSKELAS